MDQLSNYHLNDYYDEVSDCDGDDDHDDPYGASDDNLIVDSQSVQTTVEINNNGDDQNQNGDEESEKMSFCDVGFVVDQVEGDDDWCLVGEMWFLFILYL